MKMDRGGFGRPFLLRILLCGQGRVESARGG